MRRIAVIAVASLALVAAPGFEAPAAALSCAAPAYPIGSTPPPPDPFPDHPVVIDGVALSGPSLAAFGGDLDGPARFFVTKWWRGSGPRVVRVETALDILPGGTARFTPGYFSPSAGTITRLFAHRGRGGVIVDNPCAMGAFGPPVRRPLRAVPGSGVRAASGVRGWTARAQRGPAGLHCIVVVPDRRRTGGGSECEAGRPLLAVRHEGPTERGTAQLTRTMSTAIVAGGPGIRSVELRTPDGVSVLRPRRPGAPVLAVLAGHVDPALVRARVVRDDGSVRFLQPAGFPTAVTPDPGLGDPWRSEIVTDRGSSEPRDRVTCVGLARVAPRTGVSGPGSEYVSPASACGDLHATPYFFTAEELRPSGRTGAPQPDAIRTAVVGVATREVAAIVVRDPGGERRLGRGPGGQFAAVYPASAKPSDLVVEVVLRDGSTITHRGPGGANLRR